MASNLHPKTLFINILAKDLPFTLSLIEKLAPISPQFFPPDKYDEILTKHNSKSTVIVTLLKGSIIRDCPGTQVYSCCDYKILFSGLNCPFSCAYCVLQDYLSFTSQVVFADLSNYLNEEVKPLLESSTLKFRIGTGEFMDSLALDWLTDQSTKLITLFKNYPHAILELKTKSLCVEQLFKIPAARNCIISWSLNSPQIISSIEKSTPSLESRLEAALQVCKHGYRVGFHFDPLVLYPEALTDYTQVVDLLFSKIPIESIAWISLGSLRFTKGMKTNLQRRHPLFMNEFILCDDQKYRYIRPERVKLYSRVLNRIRDFSATTYVYLCMESKQVWDEVFGFHHENNLSFNEDFNKHCFE